MHKVLLSLCFPQLIFPWVLVLPLLLSSRPHTLLLAASFLAVMRPFHLPCPLPAVIHHAVLLGRLVFVRFLVSVPPPLLTGLTCKVGDSRSCSKKNSICVSATPNLLFSSSLSFSLQPHHVNLMLLQCYLCLGLFSLSLLAHLPLFTHLALETVHPALQRFLVLLRLVALSGNIGLLLTQCNLQGLDHPTLQGPSIWLFSRWQISVHCGLGGLQPVLQPPLQTTPPSRWSFWSWGWEKPPSISTSTVWAVLLSLRSMGAQLSIQLFRAVRTPCGTADAAAKMLMSVDRGTFCHFDCYVGSCKRFPTAICMLPA